MEWGIPVPRFVRKAPALASALAGEFAGAVGSGCGSGTALKALFPAAFERTGTARTTKNLRAAARLAACVLRERKGSIASAKPYTKSVGKVVEKAKKKALKANESKARKAYAEKRSNPKTSRPNPR